MERLQKYVARCGVASRRAAEQLIVAGRVSVNGKIVRELGSQVEPGADRVDVDGRPIQPPPGNVYLIVNKPRGVVTTTADPWGRATVVDLVPKVRRLFPVGRLDADSEGLLLMTDDGALANRLMHPRYGCEKEYRALVARPPTEEVLSALRTGIELEDGMTAPAQIEIDEAAPEGGCWLQITLREGRNRQVRRMLAATGLPVVRLQRVSIGPLKLGDLPIGRTRPLSRSEVEGLRTTAGEESCRAFL